jgi:TolB-like protein
MNNPFAFFSRTKVRILFCVSILLVSEQGILSDTVLLKNGQSFENVRTEIQSDTVSFDFEGKKKEIPKIKVKSVKLKAVFANIGEKLTTNVTKAPSREALSQERIRLAESLMNQIDWEAEIGEKPKLAVLNFQAGSGVTKGELETAVEIIITTLVKTNLFIVIDSQTIAKVKSEQEKYNEDCKNGTKDCSAKLGELLSANRVLTGKITKINGAYFVNGTIIDPVNNRIDFAETETAETATKLPQASEAFAKKIAGGVLEYSEVTYATTTRIQNLGYIKKSAMFPGYGQYAYSLDKGSNLQKYKGIAWGVVTLGLMAQSWISYQAFQSEKANYEVSKDLLLLASNSQLDLLALINEQSSFDRLQEQANVSKASLASLGFFYFLNLVDTYFLPTSSLTKDSGFSHFRFSTSQSPFLTGNLTREQVITIEYRGNF